MKSDIIKSHLGFSKIFCGIDGVALIAVLNSKKTPVLFRLIYKICVMKPKQCFEILCK